MSIVDSVFILLLFTLLVWYIPRRRLDWLYNHTPQILRNRVKRRVQGFLKNHLEGLHVNAIGFTIIAWLFAVMWIGEILLRRNPLTVEVPVLMDFFLITVIVVGVFRRFINPWFYSISKKKVKFRPLIVSLVKSSRSAGLYGISLFFLLNISLFMVSNVQFNVFLAAPQTWFCFIFVTFLVAFLGISLLIAWLFVSEGFMHSLDYDTLIVYILGYLTRGETSGFGNSTDRKKLAVQSTIGTMLSEAAAYTTQLIKERMPIIKKIHLIDSFELLGLGLLWDAETRKVSKDIIRKISLAVKKKTTKELLRILVEIQSTEALTRLRDIKKLKIVLINGKKISKLSQVGKSIVIISSLLTIIHIILVLLLSLPL